MTHIKVCISTGKLFVYITSESNVWFTKRRDKALFTLKKQLESNWKRRERENKKPSVVDYQRMCIFSVIKNRSVWHIDSIIHNAFERQSN